MKRIKTGLAALLLSAVMLLSAAAETAPQIVWLEDGMEVMITTLTSATEAMELIPVVIQKGGIRKCGFVNTAGEVVIEPQFDSVWPFQDGMARVAVKDENGTQLQGYIDTKGNILIEPRYHSVGLFSNGLALVMREDENGVKRYGYINTAGEEVIALTFEYAESFVDGRAKIGASDGEDSYLFGLINTEGKYLVDPKYVSIAPCSEGFYLVVRELPGGTRQYGYINENGRVAFDDWYLMAHSFSEGLAAVRTFASFGDAKYGYIDTTGKLVIKAKFADAESFSDGLAVVAEPIGKSDYVYKRLIDRTGEFVTSDEYHVKSYANGFALLYKKYSDGSTAYGWACAGENILVPPTYTAIIGDASHDVVCAAKNTMFGKQKYGYVTLDNRVAVPFQYDSATAFSDGLAVVGKKQKDDKLLYGCLNTSGELILPVEYSSIITAKNIIALKKDGRSGFFVNSGYGQEHAFTGEAEWSVSPEVIGAAMSLPVMAGVYLFLIIRDRKKTAMPNEVE